MFEKKDSIHVRNKGHCKSQKISSSRAGHCDIPLQTWSKCRQTKDDRHVYKHDVITHFILSLWTIGDTVTPDTDTNTSRRRVQDM